ncbi:MAG: ROK family protein, partial [Spirochaetia bacterium]|nr:ROK family protein [Spirochaetia bacterium]
MPLWKIGVDLGGTKTETILLDPDGIEIWRKRLPTPRNEGYNAILENIAFLVKESSEKIPEKSAGFTAGMGIPGIIDEKSGLVMNANTTVLIGNPLRSDLEERIGHPVRIENDANCFTLAECKSGAAKNYSSVFGVIMGTGCGGGLYINGAVNSGLHGIAGEWGHFSIDPDGAKCWCGNHGCIETKISGSGVEASHLNRFGKKLSMNEITAGFRNGDKECVETFLQFLDDFGRALGGLISILDPEAIVLGGGLSNIEELYNEGIKKIRQYAFHKDLKTPIL